MESENAVFRVEGKGILSQCFSPFFFGGTEAKKYGKWKVAWKKVWRGKRNKGHFTETKSRFQITGAGKL